MNWELLAGMTFLFQYGILPILSKKIGAVAESRTRKLVWQFFFASLLALVATIGTDQISMDMSFLVVSVLGAANAFACYCRWRAYDISMTRSAMVSNLDDLMAMMMGYAILGEAGVLTPTLVTGVLISVMSATVFTIAKPASSLSNAPKDKLMGWVLGYTLIWGAAMFAMRFFSLKGMNSSVYVLAWYGGAWVGSLVVRYVVMGQEEAGPPLNRHQYVKVLVLAFAVWGSIMLNYAVRSLVPITIIQPFALVAEMAIPTFLGLVVFRELHSLSRLEIITIVGGIAGVTIIAVGF